MSKASIEHILDLLISEYGERDWQPDDSPLNVLVQTILSQNTSDTNSRRAFKSLQASFPRWEDVVSADVYQIVDAIKGGGLGEVKARYIKQTLGEIQRKRGRLELDFLNELLLNEARDWLTQLPGVGTKTANCVFLFSLGRPALPVDTHIYRVAMRLGLIDSKTTVAKAHRLLESLVPADRVYSFHVLMIEHGRKVCKAQRPRCPVCTLRRHCPYFRQNQ
ncbi:MAG: endonuclease III [Phycisphaerales bacterium]|jgi:endonuclease-3